MNRDPNKKVTGHLLMEEYEQYLKYSGTTTFSSMSKADLTNLVERGNRLLEFKQKVTSPEKLA